MAPTPPVYLGGARVSPPVQKATYFGIASVAVVAISLIVLGMRTPPQPAGRRSEA